MSYFNVYPPLLIMLFFPGFSLAEGSVQSAAISHIASGIFIASQNYSQEIFMFQVGFKPTSTSMD